VESLTSFMGRSGFLPHGYCFSWSPSLLWSMVLADAVIALAYFSIPMAIVSFARQRVDFSMQRVAVLFSAFIFACGLSHVMDIWTIWQPDYAVQSAVKGLTAAISLFTAVALWPLIPKALKIPSVGQLQTAIDRLEAEVGRRRSVQESLTETEQALAVTLASIGAGFISTDREGHITRLNEVACEVLGWTPEQAVGQRFGDVLVQTGRRDADRLLSPLDAMLHDGIAREDAQRVDIDTRSGRRLPIELHATLTRGVDGTVRGMAVVFRDLSALAEAEAQRKMAEERLRLVVEASPSGILMVDSDQRITLANRRIEGLFGHAREELIGQPLTMLVPAASRQAHTGLVRDFLVDPRDRAMGAGRDLQAQRKDGSEFSVEVGLTQIATAEGRFTLAAVTDVTDRKRNEDELRRSNAELEQFAYVASHDLQEPLRMVANYTELLAKRYQDQLDDKAQKYIYYASDGARRMQRLVSDLLSFSRVGSQGQPLVPTSSQQTLLAVLGTLQRVVRESGAQVEFDDLPMVMADETQLRQLFQNLVTNAIKFRGETPPRIFVKAIAAGRQWQFSVSDNGIGLEMRFAERIFQMFQRLHEIGRFEGSGIGLAIAKRIVERHGGHIWVESEPGVGTTIHFTLAAVAESTA
jgi:PAS domain S-box-containing protein